MSSETVIEFREVWKKYSKQQVMNNSLREELVGFIKGNGGRKELAEGEFWALRDIGLKIGQGECIGFSGPNGSGKSTTLKLISKVTYPTKGAISVQGRVAPLIELGAGMHPDLTGTENIYMNGAILGLTIGEIKKKQTEIVDFAGLQEFINVPVKKYSSGMYLRLAFSIAVHSTADIFLFDEVLAVGDEAFQGKCLDRISQIRANNGTILIVSHEKISMSRVCDRVVRLERGALISGELP